MASFFWSTLGWFCRQIISRKSHRRNFLNLSPFKSYKQKSKSWVIPPPYRIRVNVTLDIDLPIGSVFDILRSHAGPRQVKCYCYMMKKIHLPANPL